MFIRELAAQSGIPATAIRYYEAIGLLPPPQRGANNYRHYTSADVERLRFVASARSLGISLEEVAEILAARNAGVAPCERVLQLLEQRLAAVDRRIADLLRVRATLAELRRDGAALPQDDPLAEDCICSLLRSYGERGAIPGVHEDHAYG